MKKKIKKKNIYKRKKKEIKMKEKD